MIAIMRLYNAGHYIEDKLAVFLMHGRAAYKSALVQTHFSPDGGQLQT